MPENKENMFLVLKREDIKKYLSCHEVMALEKMLDKINEGRLTDNKTPFHTYYVCNTDEPYAEAVHTVILGGEALKASSQSVCERPCGTSCCNCLSEEKS